jgi:DNA-binding Lrp family transcriptional regulator
MAAGIPPGDRDIPEIVEAWRLTGETDYLLRIVVPDIETYDASISG